MYVYTMFMSQTITKRITNIHVHVIHCTHPPIIESKRHTHSSTHWSLDHEQSLAPHLPQELIDIDGVFHLKPLQHTVQ